MTRAPKTVRALTFLIAATALVAGCSTTPEVSRSALEDEVSSQLEEQADTPPDVECPAGVTGEVGETQRCMVTTDSDPVDVEVEVTAVDGDNVSFSITPAVSQSNLEDEISSRLEEQVGTAPDDVECPGGLTGKVDETLRCMLTAGSDTLGVDVTVTDVQGSSVDFDIEVDEMQDQS